MTVELYGVWLKVDYEPTIIGRLLPLHGSAIILGTLITAFRNW